MLHPRLNNHGQPVTINKPSKPSDLAAWANPSATACVVPDGPMPARLGDIAIASDPLLPTDPAGWEALAKTMSFEEPDFVKPPPGFKRAAGAVVIEPDGRVWVVAPSNEFAGYKVTFPKGGLDGRSAKAAALIEVYEESGLNVTLLSHLVDLKRGQSHTRYYLARRTGGNPADMGWETQAVMLAPRAALKALLNSSYDWQVFDALEKSHG
ncbi:MAG: NUDIX hydrolase [Leptothrix sp. (in: b-proteobacteria)]